MNNYKLFFIVVSAIIVFSACSEEIDRRIMLADSLSLAHPDSAMMIMDSIEPTKSQFSRQELMRYELIRAKVQNRAYIDFTTDSVMKVVADYYDHHGSANDRMMAHYLLGCTYRDLKEAPMALQCYYDAVEAADTLSKDCDYSTMMSIWGQIAMILNSQGFPLEEIEAWGNYRDYALKVGDTLNYIRGLELTIRPYNLLGDTANILKTAQLSSKLYKEHGYLTKATIASFNEMPIYLNRGNYDKVRQMMSKYESESGYFDNNGHIMNGKESYYRFKGIYYEGIGKLDSAEYFYRLLFKHDMDFDGCNGLTRLYTKSGNIDSISKYSLLKEKCFDKIQSKLYTQTIQQRKGMYDYSRNQKIALLKENEALRNHVMTITISCLLIILCSFSILFFVRLHKKKKGEIIQLGNKYLSLVIQLNKAIEEQDMIKHQYKKLQDEKESEVITLKNEIHKLEGHFAKLDTHKRIATLVNSELVHKFRKYGRTGQLNVKPSERDWNDLTICFSNCIPSLSILINQNTISILDKQVVILTFLGLSAKEMSVILEKSASRISNLKAISNEKLFNQKDARSLFTNLRNYSY